MNNFRNTIDGKIFTGIAMMCMVLLSLLSFSCSSDNDAFFTAGSQDKPRILNTDIPDWQNGQPATLQNVDFGDSLRFKVIATPVDYTTITWYIDGELVFTGDSIVYPISEGNHDCVIVATNNVTGESTSRTCIVTGNPKPGAEKVLWEGSFSVTWGTPFTELQTTFLSNVVEGSIVRAYVNGSGQGCISTSWWRNLETGASDDDTGRGDTPISGEMVLQMTINSTSLSILPEQGFFMVGDGYTLTKITVQNP